MPRKVEGKQPVGRVQCPTCPATIPVYLNARGYFYTQCAECGTDQRNGSPVQSRLFYESTWIGEPPPRPRNVPERPPAADPAPAPDAEEQAPETESPKRSAQHRDVPPSGEPGDEPATGSGWRFLAVIGTIVLAGIGLGSMQ